MSTSGLLIAPSGLKLEDVQEDCTRVITAVARRYCDESCYALSFEDLRAEGNLKFAELLRKDWLARYPNRSEFFRLFKTAVMNHVISIVQKNRFTAKRMGSCVGTGSKPDVSMDELEWLPEHGQTDDRSSEWVAGLRQHLTPIECVVLDQLIAPGHATLIQATLDARRGPKASRRLSLRVTTRHMAIGAGMPESLFKTTRSIVRRKAKHMGENIVFNRALSALEERFGVQVPPSIDRLIVRRLFTLCARDQLAKVDQETRQHLKIVGARVPEVQADGSLQCYGVLWERNHHICNACGLQKECMKECARVGLGQMPISPEVMGTHTNRVATFTLDAGDLADMVRTQPAAATAKPAPTRKAVDDANTTAAFIAQRVRPRSPVEESIIAYLHEKFRCRVYHHEVYWEPKQQLDRTRLIFWAGPMPGRGEFNVRFCSCSDALKAVLEKHDRSWYLPAKITEAEAQRLIDQHSAETVIRSQWVAVRTQKRFRVATSAPNQGSFSSAQAVVATPSVSGSA